MKTDSKDVLMQPFKNESSKLCSPWDQEYHQTLFQLGLAHSSRGHSSDGSTSLDEEEANAPHPVDSITELVNVRLYIRHQWTTNKVAVGQARPAGDKTINDRPIPMGYAHISIDTILDKKYNKMHIDYPA